MFQRILMVLSITLLASAGWADPRMEINDDFCHFINDTANTDNENFVADCGSTIAVNDDAGTAEGYAKISRRLPAGMVEESSFVGDATITPCTMVESNGNEYTTTEWTSEIRVVKWSWRRSSEALKFVTVIFELHCVNGQQ